MKSSAINLGEAPSHRLRRRTSGLPLLTAKTLAVPFAVSALFLPCARGAISVVGTNRRYESIPASFGAPFREDMTYDAVLVLPPGGDKDPYLCGEPVQRRKERRDRRRKRGLMVKDFDMRRRGEAEYQVEKKGDEKPVLEIPAVLLVRRGMCSFADKAYGAMMLDMSSAYKTNITSVRHKLVARYMIVYNDKREEDLIVMASPWADSSSFMIGMVFVSYESGLGLIGQINQGEISSTDAGEATIAASGGSGGIVAEALKSNWTSWANERGYGPHVQIDGTVPERFSNYDIPGGWGGGPWVGGFHSSDQSVRFNSGEFLFILRYVLLVLLVFIPCTRMLWVYCIVIPREARNRGDISEGPVGMRQRIELVFLPVHNNSSDSSKIPPLTQEQAEDLTEIVFKSKVCREVDYAENSAADENSETNQCLEEDDVTAPTNAELEKIENGQTKAHGKGQNESLESGHFFEHTSCSVCLEDYEEMERLCALPCGHSFHLDCVVPWLTEQQGICPFCKTPVLPQDKDEDDDGDTEQEEVIVVSTVLSRSPVEPGFSSEENDVIGETQG